ncbi:MAG: bifunctional UDP-N-acetylmuramoyl-tripeptide:D-alanyl-D-alanine ligase/alanine racemase [Prevotella sp.]|nr:bifunctional UDP-N-acetylmuramoyl-tripeptide:D-alanyl-D-alanine ligase/alanine racemase [Prevotella sp.]MCM1074388.1 bifunctional UDP-N-acetylmuramoyl-tripeptide:D-alanyl-D-alanine ligase/alanine racemase [Ruminococcus sp.]
MKESLVEIAKVIGAEIVSQTEAAQLSSMCIDTFLTDSRSFHTDASSLFFALTTPSSDGHKYIPDLYRRGVRAFVVNNIPEGHFPEAAFLLVNSPLRALQRLGSECRKSMSPGGRVVGITGSRGKTVVKEWLNAALLPEPGVVRSPRSYNSQIGVPLSLTAITPDTKIALIEAGISRTGEMPTLAEMIAPGIAVFTGLGDDHAEGFSSLQEKAREKAKLAEGASVIVFPLDNKELANALMPYATSSAMVGWSKLDPQAAVYVTSYERPAEGRLKINYIYEGQPESAEIATDSEHAEENAATVIATMLALGYEPGRIAYGMRRIRDIATRINVSDGVNGCLLAYDAFTADIDSLNFALDFMHRRIAGAQDSRTPVLILSDLYLAPESDPHQAYKQVADAVTEAGIKRFIGVGKQLCSCRDLFTADSLFFPDTRSMMQSLSTSDFTNEFVLIKGAPEFGFDDILHNLEARTHETVLEVNLDAIVRNFNYFRSHLPASTGLIAMVKAAAYGAGSLEIAKTLQSQGASYLAVAVLDEGLELRRAGITMPIMVMNPKVVNYRAMFAGQLEPEIYDFGMLYDVIREADKCGVKQYPLHIKLDTGMHRMGFCCEDLPKLIEILQNTDTVRAATLFSHLATADCPDMDDYTELQLTRFREYTDTIIKAMPYPIKRHVLNSAGILRYGRTHHYDFARLGIGLYGVNTLPPEMEKPLSPISTLRTVIIAVRERKKGETIGYARRGVLTRNSRIATIPIGYADGMNRKFGNGHIRVLINGRECPTVGNICMDACMIDVTDVPCKPGDSVEIFGENMSVDRLAQVLDTIPYEVLTSISPRVKRVYFRE